MQFSPTTTLVLRVLYGAAGVGILRFYWRAVAGKKSFASVGNIFVLLQTLFWIGTLLAVDFNRTDDVLWISVLTGSMCLFAVGAARANAKKQFQPNQEIAKFAGAPLQYDLEEGHVPLLLWGMIALCLVLGIMYLRAVGYNVFVLSLLEYFRSGGFDPQEYIGLRTNISTDTYVASGYTAQFICILMPVLVTLLYFKFRRSMTRWRMLLLTGLAVLNIYFLTITGGRGWFIYAAAGLVLLVSPFGPLPAIWPKVRFAALTLLMVLAAFYALSTLFMGRSSEYSEKEGTIGLISGAAGEFYNRVVGDEAAGHLDLMRELMKEPVDWGNQWWRDVRDIVPAFRSDIASGVEMYAMAHNSDTTGSLGLKTWGSFLYNWGTLGTLVLAFWTGYVMQIFTISYVRGGRSLSRVVVLFYAGFRLALFRDPFSLLLDGFVTTLVLYFLLKLARGGPNRLDVQNAPLQGSHATSF